MKEQDSMEKEKIILEHKRKRKHNKIKLAIISIALILIATILISEYTLLSKNEYNNYEENAKVDYKVNLKENEFYTESTLDERSAVIASLINGIEISFNYNFDLEKEQDYTYNYKIIAKTNVSDSNKTTSIYETTDELVNKVNQQSIGKNLSILEKIAIDYNEYNEKINKFINIYNLNDVTSTLELDMYVNIINSCDGTQMNNESKVMTLSIPLTTKTVEVSIGANVVKDEGKVLYKKSEYQNMEYVLAIGVVFAIAGLVMLIKFVKYLLDTRSAETMYEQELKQILFSYKSYIQKSNNAINRRGYKIIQINSFEEILGLRDTMQTPILMYTEDGELRTSFVIINSGILYEYVLGAKEIREELRTKSAEAKKKKEKNKNK